MKELIRKILRENTDYDIIKKIVTKSFERQVNSGQIPKINFLDLKRKGLSDYQDEVFGIYHDFVGDSEEAFKLFDKYMTGKIITDVDVRNFGIKVDPEDQYKVRITRIYNPDYRGKRIVGTNEELEFGFELVYGQFITSRGILTIDELYSEEHDDIWLDVTDHLRSEIEYYVCEVAEYDFGLPFEDSTSHWND